MWRVAEQLGRVHWRQIGSEMVVGALKPRPHRVHDERPESEKYRERRCPPPIAAARGPKPSGKRNGQLRHQRPPDALAFSDSKRAIEPCGIISSPCVDAPRASQLAFDDRALMKIHEYQAKAILSRYGVPVPRGEVAFNATEAGEIAHRLGGSVVVVKAQIHAGGRGKGGGVKLARSPEEAERL